MAEQDFSRPYFGYRSAGRRPESQQDRVASANAPLSALRGYIAGTLGLPGDIEGLGRMLIPGVSNESYIPDSEYFRKVLPMQSLQETPTGRAFTELGGLAGGAGLMTAAKAGKAVAMAAGRAGERLAEKYVPQIMERGGLGADILQGLAQGSRSNVIKLKGGNWLKGSVEDAVGRLKKTAPELVLRNDGRYVDPDIGEIFTPQEAVDIERSRAINTWLDQKLTKYIKNEMATPEDPVRALAEKYAIDQPAKLAEIQNKIKVFGKKMAQTARERGVPIEDLTSMRQDMIGLEKEKALIEAKKALHVNIDPTGYEMGSIRKELGFPEEGFAVSPQAKIWEGKSDSFINSLIASDMTDSGGPAAIKANPWLLKVPPETPVYSLLGSSNRELGFKHLIDELRNATNPESGLPKNLLIDPADLGKITMPQAVERVADINAWRAAQKVEANKLIANNAATVVHKEYPTVPGTDAPNELGLRWVQFKPENALSDTLPRGWTGKQEGKDYVIRNPEGQPEIINDTKEFAMDDLLENFPEYRPKNKALKKALKYEGDTMQHCVGGYCPDVIEGRTKIFSLRDKNGEPHVTVEVKPPDRAKFIDDNYVTYLDMLQEGKDFANRWVDREMVKSPSSIVQIKGKQNRAPDAKYLPYVQDFVKSGEWSDVGDLRNVGLLKGRPGSTVIRDGPHRYDVTMPEAPYYTRRELADHFESQGVPALAAKQQAGDVEGMAKLLDITPPAEGFAQGGSVSVYDPTRIDEIMNGIDEPRGYAEGGSISALEEDTLDTFVAPRYRKQRATPSSKETKEGMAEAAKFAAEMLIPQTPMDAGLMLIPGGKIARKAGAALIALDAGDAEAGGLSSLMKLLSKEAPAQAKSIREALGRAYTKDLEHSVVGSSDRGPAGSIMSGDWDSVKPNQFDIVRAVKSNRPIVDFHTHPRSGQAAFDIAPSEGDFRFYSNEYFPGKQNRELRTLIASPANSIDRVPSSYSFFATDNPSKVFDRRALNNAVYELHRTGSKGTFKSIMDDPRFREYFDAGGSLGDLAENIAPLSMLELRKAQGLGRGEFQLSGRKLAEENPQSTNKELFEAMNPAAVEFLTRKGFAKGGSVSTYDPDQIDAIANQYM